MATRYPAEFRERAVELARLGEKPVKQGGRLSDCRSKGGL